jgi:RNA-binding protein NOB1
MATNAKGEVKHLVVDAAGFIKNIELHTIGERIYTIKEVVQEIRDAATKQRLSVLPYELIFRQPSSEAIKAGKKQFLYYIFKV